MSVKAEALTQRKKEKPAKAIQEVWIAKNEREKKKSER